MPTRTRKRATSQTRRQYDPLHAARNTLTDAVSNLCDPRPHLLERHTIWLDSRYTELRDSIDITGTRTGHGDGGGKIPCWIDALKLAMTIDIGTAQHVAAWETVLSETTPSRLEQLAARQWRPHDTEHIQHITADITAWVEAIDDLFASKPLYLPDPCPQCGFDHAYRLSDTGERIRTPALAITVERAICQNCHATWTPDKYVFLGRLLGTTQIGA